MAQAVTTNNSLSVDQLHAAATGWRYARKQVTVLVQRPSQKIQIVINYAIVVSLIYPGVGVVSCCRLMSKGCHKICILSHLCWAQPTSRCFFSAWTGFVFFFWAQVSGLSAITAYSRESSSEYWSGADRHIERNCPPKSL